MVAGLTLRAGYLSISGLSCVYYSVCNFFGVHCLLNISTTAKIQFHWIFSESHHGKGEHDGHGATVKAAIRVFVLGGKFF
jgi:hypothetical protein